MVNTSSRLTLVLIIRAWFCCNVRDYRDKLKDKHETELSSVDKFKQKHPEPTFLQQPGMREQMDREFEISEMERIRERERRQKRRNTVNVQ